MKPGGRRTAIAAIAVLALALGVPRGSRADPAFPEPADVDTARSALERDGHVSYVRYDPANAPQPAGETRFVMELSYAYSYRADWEGRRGHRQLWVTPRVSAQVSWRHTVQLPRVSPDTAASFQRLLGHELDHVAISVDPRAGLLLLYLASDLGTLKCEVASDTGNAREIARRAVDGEMSRIKEAVSALIRANYARLDSLTRNGKEPLADRPAFFAGLYTRENLEALDFPWLARVEPLLDRPEYREARRYALP